MSMTRCTAVVGSASGMAPRVAVLTSPGFFQGAAREQAYHVAAIDRGRGGSGQGLASADGGVGDAVDQFGRILLPYQPLGGFPDEERRGVDGGKRQSRLSADAAGVQVQRHSNPGERIVNRIADTQLVVEAAAAGSARRQVDGDDDFAPGE